MSENIIPLHCILPPHILTEIQEKGNDVQKEVAARMIELSELARTARIEVLGILETETPQAVPGKTRILYNANHGSNLPGNVARNEGDGPTGDTAVDEAYDGSGATYDLFSEIYGRDSIDDKGMDILSTVHFQQGYDNAFWNGRQMVYGDGDEDLPEADRLFNRFTAAVDIMGHELAHGVTGFTAKLQYQGQSGALNESMSDVFGSLVKQRILGQTADQADWIIGEGLFTSNVNGVGIRSMKAPGTAYNDPVLGSDPQPGHMDDYKDVSYDNGGVHINSGIPNRAFYVTALELGGHAWERAGRIWYVALRDRLGRTSDFEYAASRILDTAAREYGVGSDEYNAVWKGWDAVGITLKKQEPKPEPTPEPTPNPTPTPGPSKKPITIIAAIIAVIGVILGFFFKRKR